MSYCVRLETSVIGRAIAVNGLIKSEAVFRMLAKKDARQAVSLRMILRPKPQ